MRKHVLDIGLFFVELFWYVCSMTSELEPDERPSLLFGLFLG